jgi:hypothetical protein
MYKLKKVSAAIAGAVLFGSMSVSAATDGALGPDESIGTMEVAADVVPMVQITGLTDIDFGRLIVGQNLVPDSVFEEEISFCVFSNSVAYTLDIESALAEVTGGAGTPFLMVGQNDDTLEYKVQLDVQINTGSTYEFVTIAEDLEKEIIYGPFSYSEGGYSDALCSSSGTPDNNVKLKFMLDGNSAMSVVPGVYSDIINIRARASESMFGGGGGLPLS